MIIQHCAGRIFRFGARFTAQQFDPLALIPVSGTSTKMMVNRLNHGYTWQRNRLSSRASSWISVMMGGDMGPTLSHARHFPAYSHTAIARPSTRTTGAIHPCGDWILGWCCLVQGDPAPYGRGGKHRNTAGGGSVGCSNPACASSSRCSRSTSAVQPSTLTGAKSHCSAPTIRGGSRKDDSTGPQGKVCHCRRAISAQVPA